VFNQTLRDNLNGLIARDCQRIDKTMLPKRNWWRLGVSVMAFHFLRHFPAWVGWLPAHTPRLARSARRSSRKLKLRIASSLQPGIIPDGKSHPRWRMAKRVLTVLFFIAVIVLLVIYAQKVDWQDVWKVIRGYDRLACWRHCAGYRQLPDLRLLRSAGSGLLRAQAGETPGDAGVVYLLRLQPDAQHLGRRDRYALPAVLAAGAERQHHHPYFSLSITTNWLGYILLGGVIFTADLVKLPPHWYISQTTLRIIGGVMLILTLCYLFGCAFAKRRHLTIKGQRLVLPSWRFALLQMGLGGELDGDGGDNLAAVGQRD
jgi:hypothetical protein